MPRPRVRRRLDFSRPRDFSLLWSGSAAGHFGHQLTGLALPVLAVGALEASEWQMGLLSATGTAAFLLLGLPAGALVDRMSKRRVLVATDVVRALALGVIVTAALAGHASMPLLYAAAFVIGCATVFFDVAHQSFVPALTGTAHVVEGNARLQTTESLAQVAGPALAGQLLRVLSAGAVIAVNAAAYLLSAWVLTRIHPAEPPPPRRRPLRREIGEGLRFVFGHRLLMRMVLCTALGNLAWGIISALEVLYILRHLGLPEAVMGLIFSLAALGGLSGALAAGPLTRAVGTTRTIPATAAGMALPAAAIPLAAHAPAPAAVLTTGMFFTFFAMVVYNIATVSYRQQLCPPELLGRMNASVRFIVWGTTPVGGLLGGLLGETIGVVGSMWIAVVGTALAALPVLIPPLWRTPASPEAAANHPAG